MPRVKATAPKQAIKSDFEEQFGTLERIDPDEDFSDVDGDPKNEFGLLNEEDDRHYVWAHNSADGVGDYKGGVVPYRVEYAAEGGVSARMSAEQTAGEAITKRDHVLMSCDKAQWQKRNRFERVKQQQWNDLMFKKRQRDTDMRDMDAVRRERASLGG